VLRLDILIYFAICPPSNCIELICRFAPDVDISFPSDNVKGIELTNDIFWGEQNTVEKLLTDNFALLRISPSRVEYPAAENVLIPTKMDCFVFTVENMISLAP